MAQSIGGAADSSMFLESFYRYGIIAIVSSLFSGMALYFNVRNQLNRIPGWFARKIKSQQRFASCAGPLTVLYWIFIILLPITFLILWGSFTAGLVSDVIGITIIFVGFTISIFFFAGLNWRARGFRMTKFVLLNLAVAFILFCTYEIILVFVLDPFTYFGTSAVFMSFSVIFIALIASELSCKNRMSVKKFLRLHGYNSQEEASREGVVKGLAGSVSRMGHIGKLCVFYSLELAIFLAYMLVIKFLSDENENLGFFTVSCLIILDIVILLHFTTPNRKVSIWTFSLVSIFARAALISFGTQYWFLGVCIAYLFFGGVAVFHMGRLWFGRKAAALVDFVLEEDKSNAMWAEGDVSSSQGVVPAADPSPAPEPAPVPAPEPAPVPAQAPAQASSSDAENVEEGEGGSASSSGVVLDVESALDGGVDVGVTSPVGAFGAQRTEQDTPQKIGKFRALWHRPEMHYLILTLGMLVLTIIWGTVSTTPPRARVFIIDQSHELYTFGILAMALVLVWLLLVCNFLILRKQNWLIGIKGSTLFKSGGFWTIVVTQLLCAGLGGFIFGFTSSYIVLFTGIFGYLVLIMAALWAVNWKRADFRTLQDPSLRKKEQYRSSGFCRACLCCGLTSHDAKMMFYFTFFFIFLASWGLGVGFTIAASWIGWIIPLGIVSIVFSVLPVVEWFNHLRVRGFGVFSIVLSILSYIGVVLGLMLRVVSSRGEVVAAVFVVVLYPMLMFTIAAVVKWRDDKWNISTFVAASLIIVLILFLIFSIVVIAAISLAAGGVLLGLFAVFCTLVGLFVYAVKNDFVIGPKLSVSLYLVLLALIIGGFIVGGFLGNVFLGFTIAFGAVALVFLVRAIRGFVRSRKSFFQNSPFLFPVYQYQPDKDALVAMNGDAAATFVLFGFLAFWGCAAVIFLTPAYVGMGVTSLAIVLTVTFITEMLKRPVIRFSNSAEFVDQSLVDRARVDVAAKFSEILSIGVTDADGNPVRFSMDAGADGGEHAEEMKTSSELFDEARKLWTTTKLSSDGSRASLLKVLELEQRGTEKYEQETIKEVYFQLTLIMLAEGQRRSSESSFRQFIGDRIRSLSDRVQKLESGEVAEETLGELSSKKKDLARFRYLQDKKLTRLDYEAKHFLRLEFQQFQEEMQRKAAEAEARRLEDEEANRRRREEMRRLREERAGVGGGGGSSVIGGFGGSGGLGSGGGEGSSDGQLTISKLRDNLRLIIQEEESRKRKSLEEQLERAKAELQAHERDVHLRLEEHESNVEHLEEQLRVLQEEADHLRQKLEEENQNRAQDVEKLRAAEQARRELEDRYQTVMSKLQSDEATYKRQIAALEAQISSLSPRGQSGQSAASAAELEEALKSKAELQERFDQLATQKRLVEAELEESRVSMSQRVRDLEKCCKDKERLETLLAKNKEQLQVKNKSLGEATRTVRELQNVKKDLELQITSLQAEVQRLQEEKSDVENKMLAYQTQVAELVRRLQAGESGGDIADVVPMDFGSGSSELTIEQILARCKQTGQRFRDLDFRGDESALYLDPMMPSNAVSAPGGWRPAADLRRSDPSKPLCLVDREQPERIKGLGLAERVNQGALGDCWFISAISVLATDPGRIHELFVTDSRALQPGVKSAEVEGENGFTLDDCVKWGVFNVKFFKDNKWVSVIVDDLLPTNRDGSPAFAHSSVENELWVSILEKAYAKLHCSYEALVGGLVHVGLVDLSGGAADELDLQKSSVEVHNGNLFRRLVNFQRSGFLMGCSSHAGSDTDVVNGIVQGHAYSIIEVQDVDGNQLLRLRNPWGQTEWTGDWSDQSPKWTARIKAKVNFHNEDDGTFWMCMTDFAREFSQVFICRLFDNWNKIQKHGRWEGPTAGGCFKYETHRNPQFNLYIQEPKTTVFISLSQRPLREEGHYGLSSEDGIGIVVCKNGGKRLSKLTKPKLVAMSPSFKKQRDVSLEVELDPGQNPYTIVPSTFAMNSEARFTLSLYSDKVCRLEDIPKDAGVD